MLQHLARKGLTTAAVIANFHRQRVTPLTERNLPIFDLTPEAPYAGSRTSNVLLPRDVAARRAKSAVADFPSDPEDLWKIKMHPKKGYITLVSLVSIVVNFALFLSLLLAPDLVGFAGTEPQGQRLEASGPGGSPSQPPAK